MCKSNIKLGEGVLFTSSQKKLIIEYVRREKRRLTQKFFIWLFIIIVLVSLFMVPKAYASEFKEVDYQNVFAEWIGGETEVLLDDRSRVDIVTELYAIEVDWSYKWAEGIGQALFYAEKTGLRPGVVLILAKRKNHENYINRIMLVARKYNIAIWTMSEGFEIKKIEEAMK